MSRSSNVSFKTLRGEVDATGQSVTITQPRRRKRQKGWRDKVSLADLGLLSKLELSGLEWRVLMAVMANVPEKGGSDAYCSQAELASQLEILQPSVSRVMSELHRRRIIFPVKRGRWHVNAWLLFNGDFDSWNQEAETDPEPIWVKGVDVETGEVK